MLQKHNARSLVMTAIICACLGIGIGWQFGSERRKGSASPLVIVHSLASIGTYVNGPQGVEYRVLGLEGNKIEPVLRQILNDMRFTPKGIFAASAGGDEYAALHVVWVEDGLPKVLKINGRWAIDGAGESHESKSTEGFGALVRQLDAVRFYPPIPPSDLFDMPSGSAATR